jgi:predicted DNA-binding transcriptional regulator YafY
VARHEPALQVLRLALALQEPGPGWSLERIRAQFGGSRRTAERRLEAVRQLFPDLEGRLDGHRKLWRLPSGRASALLRWEADEIAGLELACDRARRARRPDHAEALERVLAKVRSLLPPPSARRLAPDVEALVESEGIAARPGPRPRIDTAHLGALRHAILACRAVRLGYRRREDGRLTRPLVHPYGFLHGHRHYLVAWSPKREKLVLYALPNVTSVALSEEAFERDPAHDVRAFAERSFGVFQDEPVDVVWRFRPGAAARDAREYVFHPTQRTEERPDGSLVVRFRACGLWEMAWHLFTWGDGVRVLEPAALRESYRAMIEAALRSVSEETGPRRVRTARSRGELLGPRRPGRRSGR